MGNYSPIKLANLIKAFCRWSFILYTKREGTNGLP